MQYKTISTSKDGQRKQVVRLLEDSKKFTSRTFHVHRKGFKWHYMKRRPVYVFGVMVEPPVFAVLPDFH